MAGQGGLQPAINDRAVPNPPVSATAERHGGSWRPRRPCLAALRSETSQCSWTTQNVGIVMMGPPPSRTAFPTPNVSLSNPNQRCVFRTRGCLCLREVRAKRIFLAAVHPGSSQNSGISGGKLASELLTAESISSCGLSVIFGFLNVQEGSEISIHCQGWLQPEFRGGGIMPGRQALPPPQGSVPAGRAKKCPKLASFGLPVPSVPEVPWSSAQAVWAIRPLPPAPESDLGRHPCRMGSA